MIMDPSYATEAVAWLLVWSALGTAAREVLARNEEQRRREGAGRWSR